MKDMTGWWGWRGSRGSRTGDPAPASQAYPAPQGQDADIADGDGADLDVAGGDGADSHSAGGGGTEAGTRRPAHRGGADETNNGVPAQLRSAPVSRLPREPTVPRMLQRAADWSWRLLLVGLLIYVAFRVASALALVVLP